MTILELIDKVVTRQKLPRKIKIENEIFSLYKNDKLLYFHKIKNENYKLRNYIINFDLTKEVEEIGEENDHKNW